MNILKIVLELVLLGLAGAAIIYMRKNKSKPRAQQKIDPDVNNNFIIKNNTVISSLFISNAVIDKAEPSNEVTPEVPVFDLTRIRSLRKPSSANERKFRKPVYRKTVYSEYFGQMAIIETIRETENPDEVEAILSPGLTSALAGIEAFNFEGFPEQGMPIDGRLFESTAGTKAYELYLNDDSDLDFSMETGDIPDEDIQFFGNEGLSDLKSDKPAKKVSRKTKKETKENGRSDLEPPDI